MFGHTHQPFVERVNGTLFLNPGSVGDPLDGDIRASYAILDLTKDPIEVETRRVEYDLEATVVMILCPFSPIRSSGSPRRGGVLSRLSTYWMSVIMPTFMQPTAVLNWIF